MAEDVFGLTRTQIGRLRTMLEAFEGGNLAQRPTLPQRRPPMIMADKAVFGILQSSVAATTTLTSHPKSGTLDLYTFTSTGGSTAVGSSVTCYNFAPILATTDRWSICLREQRTGNYMLIYQACS